MGFCIDEKVPSTTHETFFKIIILFYFTQIIKVGSEMSEYIIKEFLNFLGIL